MWQGAHDVASWQICTKGPLKHMHTDKMGGKKKRTREQREERKEKAGTMGSSAQAIKTKFRNLTNNSISRSLHSSIP